MNRFLCFFAAAVMSGCAAAPQKERWLTEERHLADEIARELVDADPDEKRLLAHAQRIAEAGYGRLRSGDPTGQSDVDQANRIIADLVAADVQARKQDEAAAAEMTRELERRANPR